MIVTIKNHIKLETGIIKNLYTNNNNTLIVFEDDKRIHVIWIEPDCCCSGFINHINGIDYLLQSKIIDVEIPEERDDNEAKEVVVGLKLKTTKGYVDIEFRSEQSPYYCAHMTLLPEYDSFESMKKFDPRKTWPNLSEETFKKITKDF